ncbi:MAG: hypothetical protein KAH21_02440 [Spirochaetaceae bacterium]|nr:hypothetical protein [Spirochaetaceae bacterium]
MPPIIHGIAGILLVLSHSLFLFRGLSFRKYGGKPGRLDKIARFISQFGLPGVIFLGFLSEKAGVTSRAPSAIHIVLGILPIIVIIAFTPFMAFKRRIPWLLPGINLVILAAAALTGIYSSL